jgi:hypothetical protein
MKSLFAMLIILFALNLSVYSQEAKDHEVSSDVKELSDFHEIIYQVWHTGWPNKDIKLLASLLPDIESQFALIKKVELPGILRDKKEKWDLGLVEFEKSVIWYKKSATEKDSVGLLNAAEKLHSDFESMVRIVKPLLKEIDAFHQVLYMLYHYYAPDKNAEKIKQSAVEMKEKIKMVKKAKPSKRIEQRKEKYELAVAELSEAVEKFNEVVKGDDVKLIEDAVDLVHTKYQGLEKIFD